MAEDKLTIKISKKKEDTLTNTEQPNKPKRVKIILSKEDSKEAKTKEDTKEDSKEAKTKEKGNKKTKPEEAKTKEAKPEEEGNTETKLEKAIIGPLSTVVSLREHCKQLGIKGISKKNKTELLEIIKNHN